MRFLWPLQGCNKMGPSSLLLQLVVVIPDTILRNHRPGNPCHLDSWGCISYEVKDLATFIRAHPQKIAITPGIFAQPLVSTSGLHQYCLSLVPSFSPNKIFFYAFFAFLFNNTISAAAATTAVASDASILPVHVCVHNIDFPPLLMITS